MTTAKHITFIYGSEEYLIEKERRRFISALTPNDGSEPVLHFFNHETAPATVLETLQSYSFFESASISIWYDCPFLPIKRGGRSRSKLTKDEEWFLKSLSHVPDENGLLCITKLRRDRGKIDTNAAFFKAFKKMADIVECNPVTDKNVIDYIISYTKTYGLTVSPQAVRYLEGLFQTWDTIPLFYVFSELDKLMIMLADEKKTIDVADVEHLFSGTMEKNLFTFMDEFLRRNGPKTIPYIEGLFSKQDAFLKNVGYMMSRLRLLRAYKELLLKHVPAHQQESILMAVNKGKSVKYAMYHLKKSANYWKIEELDRLIASIFTLQLNIRRGMAAPIDMEQIICLYCSYKGRS
ncbi:MAG: DNA polymerase III subunit delta [Megasphaera sp.]|nr:DNA polymerase III subunit delta [Megasphaera sp.]